jgi:hypothetical protein
MIAVDIPLQRLSSQVYLYPERTETVKGSSGQYECSPSSPSLLSKGPEISLHPAQERKAIAYKVQNDVRIIFSEELYTQSEYHTSEAQNSENRLN